VDVLATLPRTAAPEAVIAGIEAGVRSFVGSADQSDDITLLCVRWNGPAVSSGR